MVTLLYDTLSRRMSSGNFSSADSTNANTSNSPQNTMAFLNLSILPSNTHPMRIYLLLRVHIEKDFCHIIVHIVSFRSIFRKGRQLNSIPPFPSQWVVGEAMLCVILPLAFWQINHY